MPARIRSLIAGQDFCLSRTPGPPPFSEMNSIPAASNDPLMAAIVEVYAPRLPGFVSRRLIVGSETFEASAKSDCSQRNKALAARTCSLVRRKVDT